MDSLKHYFDKSRQLAEKNDKDLYVLCTQCFEVCVQIMEYIDIYLVYFNTDQ